MKKIMYFLSIILALLLFCQCNTRIQEKLIDETDCPNPEKLSNKYHKYEIGYFNQYKINDNENPVSFKPIIYTDIDESSHLPGFPKGFFRLSSPNSDDLLYFKKKKNGEYVLYMEKDGRITMREYAKYYNYSNDSIKNKLNTEKKIYDYLNNNYIKYKIISKHSDGYYKTRIKLLLGVNQYYTYITFGYDFIVTNMYYNAKDTLYLNNNFGRKLFRR